jgi:uncharacterized protein
MIHFIRPSNYKSDRSAKDRTRHRQKIRETIQDNIVDIISEESIIGQSGDKIIKIPIRGVKEFRFVYGSGEAGVGVGDGDVQQGDVVQKGDGNASPLGGDKAGNKPGEDIYETDITLQELTDILFNELELPHLERKKFRVLESERTSKPKGLKKVGIRAHLSKKDTAIQRIKRKVILSKNGTEDPDAVSVDGEEEEKFPFSLDDLRYKRMKPDIKEESNAVVVCIMDTSGSMDTTKKFLARSFYFLLYQFVMAKYRNTELVFIAHTTQAKEVTEDEFFHKGESGGTFISSGYHKALEVIEDRYHPSLWNIYAFHCSDGDNWSEDNDKTLRAAQELTEISNLFGYGEIKPGVTSAWESSMLKTFEDIKGDNFVTVKMTKKEDIWQAFKSLLSVERV